MLAPGMVRRPTSGFRDLGVAVCITGQSTRLELASKVAHLLRPLAKAHAGVKAFVALQRGPVVFSETRQDQASTRLEGMSAAAMKRLDRWKCAHNLREEQIYDELDGFIGAVDIMNYTSGGPAKALVTAKHLKALPSAYRDNGKSSVKARALNREHLQAQFENIARCADMVLQYEQERQGRFHTIVRVRDNSLILAPLTALPTLDAGFFKPSVYVKACAAGDGQTDWTKRGFGGINDRVAIAPRSVFQEAFSAPFNQMRAQMDFEAQSVSFRASQNAEQVLMRSWEEADVPWLTLGANDLPWVDGRCVHAAAVQRPNSRYKHLVKRWCLVPERKDCKPTQLEIDRSMFAICQYINSTTDRRQRRRLSVSPTAAV